MRVKKTGALYPHVYPPIISQPLFNECQCVLKGKNRKKYAYYGQDHIFRGLIVCGITGRTIPTDIKRKTYKKGDQGEWKYLIATNPEDTTKKVWIREEEVVAEVEAVFAKMQIPPVVKQEVITYIRKTSEMETDFHGRQIDELHREQKAIQGKLDKLIELLLDEAISREDQQRKSNQFRERQMEIRSQIASLEKTDEAFKANLIQLLDIANDALRAFRNANTAEKHKLVNFVFSNLTLRGKSLCYTIRKPFDGFVECAKTGEWLGRQDSNLGMAVPKTAALPLGYAPADPFSRVGTVFTRSTEQFQCLYALPSASCAIQRRNSGFPPCAGRVRMQGHS